VDHGVELGSAFLSVIAFIVFRRGLCSECTEGIVRFPFSVFVIVVIVGRCFLFWKIRCEARGPLQGFLMYINQELLNAMMFFGM